MVVLVFLGEKRFGFNALYYHSQQILYLSTGQGTTLALHTLFHRHVQMLIQWDCLQARD